MPALTDLMKALRVVYIRVVYNDFDSSFEERQRETAAQPYTNEI